MSTVVITPGTKNQFDLAFDLLTDLCCRRLPLTRDVKEDLDFVFLMKEMESAKEVAFKASQKK